MPEPEPEPLPEPAAAITWISTISSASAVAAARVPICSANCPKTPGAVASTAVVEVEEASPVAEVSVKVKETLPEASVVPAIAAPSFAPASAICVEPLVKVAVLPA